MSKKLLTLYVTHIFSKQLGLLAMLAPLAISKQGSALACSRLSDSSYLQIGVRLPLRVQLYISFWARAISLEVEIFPSARAQKEKLQVVLVLVLRYEGR